MNETPTVRIPRWFGILFLIFVLVAFGEAGMLLGQHATASSAPPSPVATTQPVVAVTPAAAGNCGGGGDGAGAGAPSTVGPFTLGQSAPWSSAVLTTSGQPTQLARGSKATVILGGATWCLFTGYVDRWVMPALAKTPGVVVDIVDLSPQGGIADPGPENPPFTGHDGTGGTISVTQMGQVLQQYGQQYGLLNDPNIHLYVATAKTQAAWGITSFPGWAVVGSNGKVDTVEPGALTVPQAQGVLQHDLGGK